MVKVTTDVEQILRNYLHDLAESYQIEHAIIFGSVAQGNVHPDSDIDLAIFSADVTDDDNRRKIMSDCWLKTMPYNLDIQPIVYSLADYHDADNDFIQKEIIANGIEIPVPD